MKDTMHEFISEAEIIEEVKIEPKKVDEAKVEDAHVVEDRHYDSGYEEVYRYFSILGF
jgi:hypothetical protein